MPARILILLLTLPGCFTSVYSERVGRPHDAFGADCPLEFDYDGDEARDRVVSEFPTQVGVLELAHIDGDDFRFTDEIKSKLRPAACKLGGELVLYALWYPGSIATGKIGKFLVFRRKS